MDWSSRLLRRFAPVVFIVLVTGSPAARARPTAWAVWEAVPDSVPASDTLSLLSVLTRVKKSSALLRGLAFRAEGARSLVDQAGAHPNPGISFEAENLGGSYSGFDRAELSLRLEQELELGGKRSKRVEVATSAWEEVTGNAEVDRFELFLEVRSRYADVVHAEERLRLATAADTVVAGLAKSAEERVRAGATLRADASMAAVARVRSQTAIDDAIANRFRARLALSTLWGDPDGFDDMVTGFQPTGYTEIPADSALAWASDSPSVRQLRLASATLRAEANLQRGLRAPNIVVGGGARRVETDDAYTFLLDVALPVPLWDRRGGAIRAADAHVRTSEFEVERARAEVSGLLASRINTLSRARARLSRMENELIPSLAAALENMRTAYAIGRTSYSDLLDVTRALIELEHDTNDMHRAIIEEQIAIERLAGRTIEELMTDD